MKNQDQIFNRPKVGEKLYGCYRVRDGKRQRSSESTSEVAVVYSDSSVGLRSGDVYTVRRSHGKLRCK